MSSLAGSLRQASRSLRRMLLGYWLGSSLLIGAGLVMINVWHQYRQIAREGEQATHMVISSLRSPLSVQQRQQLILAYDQSNLLQRFDRVNLLLVLDRTGRIVYTSRSAWRTLKISDPLMDQIAGDDPDFGAVVRCFRQNRSDCMELHSHDWHLHWNEITVVRPVWIPPKDLGLPREPFLVIVNFDGGMLISDTLQDLPPQILLACTLAALLTAALWYLISLRLIPELVEVTQTDALTQLTNRSSFMEMAMEVLAEAEERHSDLVFAIFDIDHFKRINDTYGHSCGDAALASVGSLLLTVTRPEDLVCRFGGEEFAMLLSAPQEAGNKALERLRLQLEMNTLHYNGHRIPLTVSIGAAATSQCGYNIDFLYNAADKALYAAKHGGRNRLVWNSGGLGSRLANPSVVSR